MVTGGIAGVQARIAEITTRFAAAPAGFSGVLAQASTAAAEASGSAEATRAPASRSAPAYFPGIPVAGSAPAPAPGGSSAVTAGGAAPLAGQAAGVWVDRLPEAGRRWSGEIAAAAEAAGIDPRLLAALVRAESGFNPDARSPAGAIGLAQLMPGTAAGLGVDPTDPRQNLRGGARYLREQLDRFGSPELALAAYNAGPGRVSQAGGIPAISETQQYVVRVMGYARELGVSP